MTIEEKRIKIAEACNHLDRWVLVKSGYYYRPDAAGYTGNINEAWVVTEAIADKHVHPHDEPVTKRSAPLLRYFESLDACHEMEKVLTFDNNLKFFRLVHDIMAEELGLASRFDLATRAVIHASASHRAEAFGQTLELW